MMVVASSDKEDQVTCACKVIVFVTFAALIVCSGLFDNHRTRPGKYGWLVPGRGGNMKHKKPNQQCFPHANGPFPPRKGQIKGDFGLALSRVVSKPGVMRVIEIGTWFGGGSTIFLADALQKKANCVTNTTHHCCEGFVISFEVNQLAWQYAREFLQRYPVWLVLGTTVNGSSMLSDDEIPSKYKNDHYRMYYKRDKVRISDAKPKLESFCRQFDINFVLIDGNEYTGYAEFVIIKDACKPKYIALHDTSTLGTIKVEEYMADHPEEFVLIDSGENMWVIYRYNPKEPELVT